MCEVPDFVHISKAQHINILITAARRIALNTKGGGGGGGICVVKTGCKS